VLFLRGLFSRGGYIEAKFDYVIGPHDVGLAFGPDFAGGPGGLLGTGRD
jgi:hypothetical protein